MMVVSPPGRSLNVPYITTPVVPTPLSRFLSNLAQARALGRNGIAEQPQGEDGMTSLGELEGMFEMMEQCTHSDPLEASLAIAVVCGVTDLVRMSTSH
jgi:hypothetical protein